METILDLPSPEEVLRVGRKRYLRFLQRWAAEDRLVIADLSPAERVAGLSPAERVAGLSLEERVVGLPLDELKAYVERLSRANIHRKAVQPPLKRDGSSQMETILDLPSPEEVLRVGRKRYQRLLQLFSAEDRLVIADLSPAERVAGLSPAERVAGLSLEERVVGLPLDELNAYVERLSRANIHSKAVQPPLKRDGSSQMEGRLDITSAEEILLADRGQHQRHLQRLPAEERLIMVGLSPAERVAGLHRLSEWLVFRWRKG